MSLEASTSSPAVSETFDIQQSEGSLSNFFKDFIFFHPTSVAVVVGEKKETDDKVDIPITNNDDTNKNVNDIHHQAESLNRISYTIEPTVSEHNKTGFFNLMSTFQRLVDDPSNSNTTTTTNTTTPSTDDDDDAAAAVTVTTTTSTSSLIEMAREFNANIHGGSTSRVGNTSDNNQKTKDTNNKDMEEFWSLIKECKEQWSTVLLKENSNITHLSPLAFMYYLGYEESRNTPSYRRRMHRFYPNYFINEEDDILVETQLRDLHNALYLSTISYMTKVEDIHQALDGFSDTWVMVYCEVNSRPRQPAHYICLKKEQEKKLEGTGGFRWPWQGDNILDVLLVVRGTKEIGDVLSDALIETVPYGDDDDKKKDGGSGGFAHGGILKSANYLVEKHTKLLETLLKESGHDKIRLSIIGHSLGAGAGAIAAIEWNKKCHKWMEVKAIGFGCPPILSKELSESTKDYITTIVCDSDVVPRMSGATISNVVNDVMSRSYKDMAMDDIHQVLDAISDNTPYKPPEEQKKFVIEQMKKKMEEDFNSYRVNRCPVDVVLFPPGKCIHLYNDGIKYSASYVPCTFFNKIEVTRTMLNDHRTGGGYSRVIHEMMRTHLDDLTFVFPHSVERASRLCG